MAFYILWLFFIVAGLTLWIARLERRIKTLEGNQQVGSCDKERA